MVYCVTVSLFVLCIRPGTIEYIPEASCTTNVPSTNHAFVSQRYRWTSSTYCCIIKSPLESLGFGVHLSNVYFMEYLIYVNWVSLFYLSGVGIAWIIDAFSIKSLTSLCI